MYKVINRGNVIGNYQMFCDAWLLAVLLPLWSRIKGPDGNWVVNPPRTN